MTSLYRCTTTAKAFSEDFTKAGRNATWQSCNLHFTGTYKSEWCDAEGKPNWRASWGYATSDADSEQWPAVSCTGVVEADVFIGASPGCLTVASVRDKSPSARMHTCDGALDVAQMRVSISPLPYHTRTGSDRCFTLRLQRHASPDEDLSPAYNVPVDCEGHAVALVAQGTYNAYLDSAQPLGGVENTRTPPARRITVIGPLSITRSDPMTIELAPFDEALVDVSGDVYLNDDIDLSCNAAGKGKASLWIGDQVIPICNGRFAGRVPSGAQTVIVAVQEQGTLSTLFLPDTVIGSSPNLHLNLPAHQMRIPIGTLDGVVGLQLFGGQRLVSMSWFDPGKSVAPTNAVLVAWVPQQGVEGGTLSSRDFATGFNYLGAIKLDPFAMTPVDVIATVGDRPPAAAECEQLRLIERSTRGALESDGFCHLRTLVNQSASDIYRPIVADSATGAMYATGKLNAIDNKLVSRVALPPRPAMRHVRITSLLSHQPLPNTTYELCLVPINASQTGGIPIGSVDEQQQLYFKIPLTLTGQGGLALEADLPPWTYQAILAFSQSHCAAAFRAVTFSVK